MPAINTNEQYWSDYDGLQQAKHRLLESYLGGWFPILSSWNGRVLYFDCHAGRGKHETGHEGSPLLALRTLLNHRNRLRILRNTVVKFVFFEINRENHELLQEEIQSLGVLPANVEVQTVMADYEAEIWQLVGRLRSQGQQLAPVFAFLDPFGFSLSMSLCNELLQFQGCELLINFMYRYVDMAVRNPSQAQNLDRLFGCGGWRAIADIRDVDKRTDEALSLFSEQLDATWVTHMRMRGNNGALKYVLLHASNSPKGRRLMKEAMWRTTHSEVFTAFEYHNPSQPVLIEPKPNLAPLADRLWTEFAGKQVSTAELYQWLLGESYCQPHLHTLLRQYRSNGTVDCSGYEGRFAFKKYPLWSFPSERPV